MGRITQFLFGGITMKGRGASYNNTTGVINHPVRGQGKVKVKTKTKTTKSGGSK